VKDKLEIFIFTYNRAESLRRTLSQLESESVRNFRITVLDNHSTDATPEVCAAHQKRLPNLRIVRHPKNIGGLANFLRAPELAEAEYTWVICDDDSFDFTKAQDIFEEINRGELDVISVGVEGHSLPAARRGGLSEFALRENFFLSHSFVPSTIFRTVLFDSNCLRAGYDNIDTMFPHFPFLVSLVEANRSIYVSKEKVISKSNNVGYSTFRFMSGWLKSCRRIADARLRNKVIAEVFGGQNFLKTLVFATLIEREHRPTKFRAEFKEARAEAALTRRLTHLQLLAFSPLVFAPNFVHRALWKKFSEYRRRRGSTLPNFDEAR
jgi:glycosyltransferase involved in cell wall biosynthesis